MTQPIYTISTHFRNEQKSVDRFLAWYEHASYRAKRVLQYLKGFAHHGRIFPAYDTIAKHAGFSERHTKRIVGQLLKIGVIGWKRRPYHSNEYYVADFLLKINLKDQAIFRKIPQKVVNIDRSDHSFSLGKCHYTCHPNSISNSPTSLRKENVDVRLFSVEKGGSLDRKREVLARYYIPEKDQRSFLGFSERSIARGMQDTAHRSAIGLPRNWVGYAYASCEVYEICETQGVTPNVAWQIRAQNKQKRKGK